MMNTKILFILSFVVLVIIIITSDTMTDALLMASLFINFLAVYSAAVKYEIETMTGGFDSVKSRIISPNMRSAEIIDEELYKNNTTKPDDHDRWLESKNTYNLPTDTGGLSASGKNNIPPISYEIGTNSMDLNNTILARNRARDKACLNGMITKTADYYKFHYGDDLENSENRPWWGRYDY